MNSVLLIIFFQLTSCSSDIEIIRELYKSAYISESNCNNLGKKLNNIKNNKSVLIKGYEGCFYLIKCKFSKSYIEKIKYFTNGKTLLETAIKLDPESVELKFLRYSIQKNLPKFLFYNNIEKDFNFVNKNIDSINDKKTKQFILNSLIFINQ